MFARTIWNCQVYREITEVIERCKPDVVHCHNTFPLISPSVYWAAARQGVPVVQTLHNYRLTCINPYLYRSGKICEDCVGRSPIRGIIHKCYRDSLAASFTVAAMLMVHRLLGTYRNKVTTYIALTEFGRKKFLEGRLCSPDKVVVKPNAVAAPSASESTDLSQSERGLGQSPSGNYALTDGPPTVLYAGRLSPEKGVDILINAWLLCHDKLPLGSRLHIIGDGPERAKLQCMAEGHSEIIFFGSVPHDQIASHMRSATALVLPTRCYEMFAITPLEAMQIGLTVILSESAATGSIITGRVSGLIFENENPQSLATILRECLLSDSNLLKQIRQGAIQAFEKSCCARMKNVENLTTIFAHIIATQTTRGDWHDKNTQKSHHPAKQPLPPT